MQLYQECAFVVYSILKAFLPLPSLEILLIPLCISQPSSYLRFAFEGAVGTFIGGFIGYMLALKCKDAILCTLVSSKQLEKGTALMRRYGILAVFIGGITPIPDFILPYLAGFTQMNFFAFSIADGVSRFLRSWFIGYSIYQASDMIDLQQYGNTLCIILLIWGMIRWLKGRYYAVND